MIPACYSLGIAPDWTLRGETGWQRLCYLLTFACGRVGNLSLDQSDGGSFGRGQAIRAVLYLVPSWSFFGIQRRLPIVASIAEVRSLPCFFSVSESRTVDDTPYIKQMNPNRGCANLGFSRVFGSVWKSGRNLAGLRRQIISNNFLVICCCFVSTFNV